VPAEVFVDTSAWYPLLLRAHPDHDRLAAPLRALAFVRTVAEPPNVVVHSTAEVEAKAIRAWLRRYRDQDFSFTDAVSFVVMTERRIDEALTLDRRFRVAGFRAVATVT
jgi:predicted nucleic acid-binding protein